MRSIFISRDLDADDRLHIGMTEMGYEVHAKSLIQIQPLPFSVPDSGFDWIFLASKNAAKIFLPHIPDQQKSLWLGKLQLRQ